MIEHLESGIRKLVEGFINAGKPCPSEQPIEARRAGYQETVELAGKGPEMTQVYIDIVDGITLKIFRPSNASHLPITIYFHGGCFISGGFDTHEQQLRQLAAESNNVVISVQYRLAPEHTYPAAHDDAYNAVVAIREMGSKYGGDTERISLVGDSAGGHLTLVTTMRLKQRQNWLPERQILIYPMLDPHGSSASYKVNATDYIITDKMLLSGFDMYLSDKSPEHIDANPELNPLLCGDFRGLPPTSIITAEFDPLRDEGEQLYRQLLKHGVEAHCERYLGVIHGFYQLSAVSQSAVRCISRIAAELASSTPSTLNRGH
ncbi:alpha/beta hydrolase [Vibrio coralliilyticus]|uniref:Alpha/beta hydrolase n=1 Tax=Vibrio coralliilyticus TaxID=190893 RepID=A0AAP7DBP5_9VIBR|nr:alpha/beta hydrolase [Vibrio coralliilyticus]NOJ21206.1 alpha/beta hydrolase [Vibrio coralliilyticus]